jgi:hypothetical protein
MIREERERGRVLSSSVGLLEAPLGVRTEDKGIMNLAIMVSSMTLDQELGRTKSAAVARDAAE